MTMLINPYRYADGGGGGGSFDPLSISWDLAFWADDPDWTDPGDGNGVSSWRDAGTIGSNATQATGSKQPIYRASVAAFNNRATLEFAYSSGHELATGLFPSDITTGEVFLVGRARNVNANDTVAFFQGDASHRWALSRYRPSSDNQWRLYRGGSSVFAGTGDDNPHAFRLICNSTDEIVIDGTSIGSGDAGNEPLQRLRPGAGAAGGGGFGLTGDIAFLAIVAAGLTAQERSDLLAWSQSYYGTP